MQNHPYSMFLLMVPGRIPQHRAPPPLPCAPCPSFSRNTEGWGSHRSPTGTPWEQKPTSGGMDLHRDQAQGGDGEESPVNVFALARDSPGTSPIFWRRVAAGKPRGTRSPLCMRCRFGQKDFAHQRARSSHRQPPSPVQRRAFAWSHGGTTRRTKGKGSEAREKGLRWVSDGVTQAPLWFSCGQRGRLTPAAA